MKQTHEDIDYPSKPLCESANTTLAGRRAALLARYSKIDIPADAPTVAELERTAPVVPVPLTAEEERTARMHDRIKENVHRLDSTDPIALSPSASQSLAAELGRPDLGGIPPVPPVVEADPRLMGIDPDCTDVSALEAAILGMPEDDLPELPARAPCVRTEMRNGRKEQINEIGDLCRKSTRILGINIATWNEFTKESNELKRRLANDVVLRVFDSVCNQYLRWLLYQTSKLYTIRLPLRDLEGIVEQANTVGSSMADDRFRITCNKEIPGIQNVLKSSRLVCIDPFWSGGY